MDKKEYIEREALLRWLCGDDPSRMEDYYYNAIKNAPAADVVEVVRCKDCRFCKKHPTSDKTKMCTNEQQWVTECYPLVYDNDYCSYGERKEE